MNTFDSNESPNSTIGFICFTLTAIFLFMASSDLTSQSFFSQTAIEEIDFYSQPSFKDLLFKTQPHFDSAPFSEETQIMSFTGNKSFTEFGQEELFESFKIFPNPATDFLVFELEDKAEVFIYSKSGEILLSSFIEKGLTEIDLDGIPPGNYYVKVKTESSLDYTRIVIRN